MKTIRELRDERGWTQLELAFKVGVTPTSIYNWESGRFQPRLKQMRDLAAAFGVGTDEISFASPSGEETKKLVA